MTLTGNRAAAASALALLALSSPAVAAPCPVIAISATRHQAQILVGEGDMSSGRCHPAGAGTRWLAYVLCGEVQEPTPLSPVALPGGGLPFEHQGGLWTVAPESAPMRHYIARPAGQDLRAGAVWLDALAGSTAFATSRVDAWTWSLVEQEPGSLLARWITTEGSDDEMRVLRQESWVPGWPAGTVLVAAGVGRDACWAFGRKPDGGVAVSVFPEANVPDVPALPSEAMAGALVGDAPVLALASGTRLRLLTLGPSGWREDAAPALQPPLPAGTALALAGLGDGGGVLASAWTGSDLVVARRGDGGWTISRRTLEVQPQAELRPRVPAHDPSRPGAIRWALPATTMALGLLAAAMLWWWWKRG